MKRLSYLMAGAMLLGGCASSTVAPTVSRVDSNTEIALSDKWNATDSQLVAQAMMDDMVTFAWYRDFSFESNNNPAIIVQNIRNRSHEHIEVETFINDLKRGMLRAGRIDFVASGAEREDVRDERMDQSLNASIDTAKDMGEEYGADYALTGSINSFVDMNASQRVTFFQVDLKLIDLKSNKEVWVGQEKIQKVASR